MRESFELNAGQAPHPASAPLGAPSPRTRGEGNRQRSGISLLPVITGRRWRQPDEGQAANAEGAEGDFVHV
jgi:hypothetical protein